MSLSHNATLVKEHSKKLADSKSCLSGTNIRLFQSPTSAFISELAGKEILLGVTGGVAIRKIPNLIKLLKDSKCEVQVVITEAGKQLAAIENISMADLEKSSGNPILQSVFDKSSKYQMPHIDLARKSDVVLIAPATANTIAKLAQGSSDNLLTTICLATRSPIVIAPAMNTVMWDNPATQTNLALLKTRGVTIIEPVEGRLACGEIGIGKMQDEIKILKVLIDVLQKKNSIEVMNIKHG